MSKPIQKQALQAFQTQLNKDGLFMQALALLENLKEKKMLRIPAELSKLLENEENYTKIKNAKNVDELLELLLQLNADATLLKIYPSQSLKLHFPKLAKAEFL